MEKLAGTVSLDSAISILIGTRGKHSRTHGAMSNRASIAIAKLISRSKDVRAVLATQTETAHAPVHKKGTSPFTEEEQWIAAKPITA